MRLANYGQQNKLFSSDIFFNSGIKILDRGQNGWPFGRRQIIIYLRSS